MTTVATRIRKRPARKASRKRPSVIEMAPRSDDAFFESAVCGVLALLQTETTGCIFIQRDDGTQWRLTLERCREGEA